MTSDVAYAVLDGGAWKSASLSSDVAPGCHPCGHSTLRIVVLGATGRIGGAFVEQALGAGHRVVALVRSQRKANIVLRKAKARWSATMDVRSRSDWLEQSGCAALERLLLEQCPGPPVSGTVVVNAVGPVDELSNLGEVQRSTRSCIAAMEAAGVRKLLVVGGSSQLLGCPQGEGRMWWEVCGTPPHMARQLDDALAAYDELEGSSLDYVMVCPGLVKTGPRTGKYIYSVESTNEHMTATTHTDLAELLLREAECDRALGGTHKRVRVGIHSYGYCGSHPRINSRTPLLEGTGSASLRTTELGSIIGGTTFPRQRRDTLGYGRAMLEMPVSRWGALRFAGDVPASRSAVRSSRHMRRTPDGLGVLPEPNPLRTGGGNLCKGDLLLATRSSVKIADGAGTGPRPFPDFPYRRRKPGDALVPRAFAKSCGWSD